MAESLVLVHSPVVGPLTWQPAAACLRNRGHHVVVPALTAKGPPYHRTFADVVIDSPAVLVGHSGAGALLPAIAEQAGDRVSGAVFVDALLPHPGRSIFDTAPAARVDQVTALARDGRLPPWNQWFPNDMLTALLPDEATRERFIAELPEVPLAYFREPAPVLPSWSAMRCAYVRLSETYDESAREAERRGWWVHRENADHLAMLTQPDRIADVIARAAAAVCR